MKKDLNFAWLISSINVPEKTEKWIREAFEKNKKIFGRAPSKRFKVVICNSEKEWKDESKYYYLPFGSGTVLRDATFVVKEQKFLKRTDKDYKNILDHEMNHVFFALFYGTTKPLWILEGLAEYMGGYSKSTKEILEGIKQRKINHNILEYRYLQRNFSNKEVIRLNYEIWKKFIEFITDNNPKLIVDFMNSFTKHPTKRNYDKLFLEFFGQNQENKFKTFILWLNNANSSHK